MAAIKSTNVLPSFVAARLVDGGYVNSIAIRLFFQGAAT